ncbi:hypothetical protein BGM26_07155 [Bacillus sp. FJAT-29790]|uniref:hypothetical protein n=1 Tax=Bacillus sp. FJAT-29790 TaxID=1895002 RepID=UPI001C218BED|nr:hypothetical protein [Bacillus sp. FJAT-29790]MBU8878768.1 hypothetical protein [Bacillus sp. FJAT-29790]
MINDIQTDLRDLVYLYKEKPYLPFWGELFSVLQRLKKVGKNTKSIIFLYETETAIPVFYHPIDNRFCIELPGFNIFLNQEEFIDSILEGRFWPK